MAKFADAEMICSRCGTENAGDALECRQCREKLSRPELSKAILQAPDETPTVALTRSDDKTATNVAPEEYTETLPTLRAGRVIGRRYRVVETLGRGGMGMVYRVYDERLDRNVALKLIRSEIAENPAVLERFRREIQISSTVTHRNVVRVYDLGEADGLTFLTMQFIEGEDLGNLLSREGALPISRVADILRQICEGLKAAHEQGVVHRDLKPRNIMLTASGVVYLTDFGLATTSDRSGLTETGHVVGTPSYMSPEQVKGETIGPQSDIFSLGVILYEMVAGKLPYAGDNVYQVMAQRVHKIPDPVTDSNPNAPLYLQEILNRCLAIEPSARYQAVEEILADLNAATIGASEVIERQKRRQRVRVLAAVLVVILAAGAWWLYKLGEGSRLAPQPPAVSKAPLHRLLVLPFENETGDSSLEWCEEGLARMVADGLSQSRFIHVGVWIPDEPLTFRTVEEFEGWDIDEINARMESLGLPTIKKPDFHLLSGDIRRESAGIALTVRVVDSQSGRQIAARRVGGLTPSTLIEASDQVAAMTKQALGLPPTEKVDLFAADFLSKNPKAYEHYIAGLKALDAYHYADAERAFQAALVSAPDYVMARYRLAHSLAAAGRTDEALAQIRKATAETSSLSEREAMYVDAAEAYFDRRYDEALTRYATLLKQYPYEHEARRFRASIFLETRRYDEAIEEASLLASLTPENHTVWAVLGAAYLAKRDFQKAAAATRKYAELEPDSANAHEMLADFYRSQSELDMAAEEYAKALQLDPAFRSSAMALAVVDVLRGRRGEAARRLKALVSDSSAVLTDRVDAAFELSYVLRSQGRFREAARLLASVQDLLREEKIREAMALSVRGNSLMELGEFREAERLIRLAIQRSPQGGAPTRYLFVKALLEIRMNRFDEARKTASLIAANALPPGDPDRTEQKAAAYLKGLAFLGENRPAEAVTAVSPALSLAGYDYANYRLAQARAYLESSDLPAAFAAARQATSPLDPVDPRLDLELDRVRGLLLLAQIQKAMGNHAEAVDLSNQFLKIWSMADPGLPDLAKARQIAGGSPSTASAVPASGHRHLVHSSRYP